MLQRSVIPFILAIAAVGIGAADSPSDGRWREKVDPWVLESGRFHETEFLVFLDEQADLGAAEGLLTKQEKGAFVVRALAETAKRSQEPLLRELAARGVDHRPYWVANMIWVRGELGTVQAMAENPAVAHIYANPSVRVDAPPVTPGEGATTPETVEWNIALVNADDVWAAGVTGSGAVVAGQDTGYLWDHPALVNQYRGNSGDHNYHWHDAIHSGGGSCGADSPEPCDDHGHGTHTMGTIVGDDGVGNQVGMAPTAQWIGCRNMDQGTGTPTTYAECYQFFIAPTDLNDENPDPAMAPDVINNSWGCPPSEGCTDPNVLLTVVQNVRAAGIVTVHSAGNDGSSCSSVADPSAIYGESFSVGATTSTDSIASYSSRGPVTVDGSNRLKPDISAPGSNIRSSTRDGGYEGGWNGTSMAGPHVAGLVALLISTHPGLAGDVDLIEEVIEQTAVPLTSSQGCGGIGPTEVPNNVYGWGRIDALAAFNYPLDFRVAVEPDSASVCAPADALFDITVEQLQGFSEPVTLSVDGLPTGTPTSFASNPVIPPGTSRLTVSDTAGMTPGSYEFDVVGTSSPSALVQQGTATLHVFDAVPAAVAPAAPLNGATDVSLLPTLGWDPAAQAAIYLVRVATDPGFSNLVASAEAQSPSHTLEVPLAPESPYYWQVAASNSCGDGPWSETFSFITRAIPPILLVDDDDNSPDVRPTYIAGLDALGLQYDVWDTNNSDVEPSAAELAPYLTVIWFTGDEFGGVAGPGAPAEADLGNWLAGNGTCLLISAQDYFYDRGLTSFMQNYLGLASATSDTDQTTVTGANPPFLGHGPFSLIYPFSNYSDTMTPTAGGQTAFTGDQGDAAVSMSTDSGIATYWGFPWEALPTATDREATLQAFMDACHEAGAGLFQDGFETGTTDAWFLIVQ